MPREILVKVTIDWEDYEDVSDELILEDSGIYDGLKIGVLVKNIDRSEIIKYFLEWFDKDSPVLTDHNKLIEQYIKERS